MVSGVRLIRTLITAACIGALAVACSRPDERSEFEREFEGSYPKVAEPNGTVRSFEIAAAPAAVPLFSGQAVDVWAYNGRVPGPTLRIRLGDTLRVTLTNRLPQPTTIHWHGVRVPNNMDGVPGVTQPPVMPGEKFVYEFTPKDAGTFWFHPHVRASEQVERGLFGALIVEDKDPLPYSQDLVWVLDDWLLTREGVIAPEFNTRHDLAHDGRWGNKITINGDELFRLTLRPGERIRLRIINVANGRVFMPDFTPLDAKIIAMDGMYASKPFSPDGLRLSPGNRVDLDITAQPELAGKSFGVVDRFTGRANRLAEVVIEGERIDTPSFPPPAAKHMPTWKGAENEPTRFELRLNARGGGPFGIQWTLNEHAMQHSDESHDDHSARYQLPLGKWNKLRFVNESARLHPMHIHGVFFKLLARNGTRVEEPHWRDTVLVHPRETVDIGLVADDPGTWMLHCHILEHAESGMMTLIDVR